MLARGRPRLASVSRHYSQAAAIAAEVKGVSVREVLSARRRRGAVAEARRLAAYLTVVCFDHSRRQVARLTGVNAMVISRSCAEIEEGREDLATDAAIGVLEARLR